MRDGVSAAASAIILVVKLRASVAGALVFVMLAQVPRRAHAEGSEVAELASPRTDWVLRSPMPIDLRLHAVYAAPPVSAFAPAPKEIRLSHGAITAIIIGGIIVGVLVIAGVVIVASKPSHGDAPKPPH